MPFFQKFSVALLVLSAIAGQFWLHDDASPEAVQNVREELSQCPALNQDRAITSVFDLIRARDSVWIARISDLAGVGENCEG